MKLPREVSGDELARALRVLGYSVTRQIGSHLRLTTLENGEHHVTIPDTMLCASARSQPYWMTWPRISR